jgi:Sulfotransferase family
MNESTDLVPSPDRAVVFVVGCPRSGTTWVRSILAAHPNVVSGDESHLFPTLYGAFAGRGRPSKRKAAALDTYDRWARGEIGVGAGPHRWVSRERLCELLDEFVLDTKDERARVAAGKAALGTILEEFATASGDGSRAVLVEKTPGHLYYSQTILEWWPTARVVEVIRDGRDVCASLQHKSMVRPWAPADRTDQIDQWVRAIRHGAAARRQPVAHGRWLSMHYETLSTDTCGETRRLFTFAGLPAGDQLIDTIVAATDFSALPSTGPRQHRRKGVVGDHRNHFSEADHRLFREVAGDVFEAAGYRF